MGNFRTLRVWEESRKLVVDIYKITDSQFFVKDFGLKDQLRRAAVSIPSNIAEGDELGTNKWGNRHLFIAKGSCAEIITQLILSGDIGYLSKPDVDDLVSRCEKISIMLHKMIKVRSELA